MLKPELNWLILVLYRSDDEQVEIWFEALRQSCVEPAAPSVETRIIPLTSSRSLGDVVPIPTLVLAVAPLTPLMLPSTRLFDNVTNAPAPIAVAFDRLVEPIRVKLPISVLFELE